jgi:hypothetical protein
MKVKSDIPQVPLMPTEINAPVQQGKIAEQPPVQRPIKEAQINPAWQSFTQQQINLPTQQVATTGQTALRQQIQLARGEGPAISSNVSAMDLAHQFGIDPSLLALAAASQVSMSGTQFAPRVDAGEMYQSSALTSAYTPLSPTALPARAEAKELYEKVLEQSYMPLDTRSDNMARDLVNKPDLMEALTSAEKARLVDIMGTGIVGNTDQTGILTTLAGAKNAQEFQEILQMAGGEQRLRGLMTGQNTNEFNFLIDKNITGIEGKDHPLRGEARGAFEQILRQHHQDFDTKADNMTRDLCQNPRMMDALTATEKGRLIQIMGSGVVSKADQRAIIGLLKSCNDGNEFWRTMQAAGGQSYLNGLVSWKEQGQLNYLIDKFQRDMATQSMYNNPTYNNIQQPAYNPNLYQQPMMTPALSNPWSVAPVSNYHGGYNMGMQHSFAMGMATGMAQPFDFGIGTALRNAVGSLFRSVVQGVMNVVRMAVQVGISAGVGFLIGGPAGAATAAANSLVSMMTKNLFGSLGSGFPGAALMQNMFSSMMGSFEPLCGTDALLGTF